MYLSEGRGESGCSATRKDRKCLPGLTCDEDFYCILDRGESSSSSLFHLLPPTSFALFTFFSSLRLLLKLLVCIQCTSTRRLHGSHRVKLMEASLRSNVAVINWLEGFEYRPISHHSTNNLYLARSIHSLALFSMPQMLLLCGDGREDIRLGVVERSW